jgi:hypothetical protein
MSKLAESDKHTVLDWASRGIEEGSNFPGMSYEEGIRDAFELMDGNISVDDLTGE